MRGSALACSLDGVPLLHANDGSIAGGRVGLIALGGLTSEFRDVTAAAFA